MHNKQLSAFGLFPNWMKFEQPRMGPSHLRKSDNVSVIPDLVESSGEESDDDTTDSSNGRFTQPKFAKVIKSSQNNNNLHYQQAVPLASTHNVRKRKPDYVESISKKMTKIVKPQVGVSSFLPPRNPDNVESTSKKTKMISILKPQVGVGSSHQPHPPHKSEPPQRQPPYPPNNTGLPPQPRTHATSLGLQPPPPQGGCKQGHFMSNGVKDYTNFVKPGGKQTIQAKPQFAQLGQQRPAGEKQDPGSRPQPCPKGASPRDHYQYPPEHLSHPPARQSPGQQPPPQGRIKQDLSIQDQLRPSTTLHLESKPSSPFDQPAQTQSEIAKPRQEDQSRPPQHQTQMESELEPIPGLNPVTGQCTPTAKPPNPKSTKLNIYGPPDRVDSAIDKFKLAGDDLNNRGKSTNLDILENLLDGKRTAHDDSEKKPLWTTLDKKMESPSFDHTNPAHFPHMLASWVCIDDAIAKATEHGRVCRGELVATRGGVHSAGFTNKETTYSCSWCKFSYAMRPSPRFQNRGVADHISAFSTLTCGGSNEDIVRHYETMQMTCPVQSKFLKGGFNVDLLRKVTKNTIDEWKKKNLEKCLILNDGTVRVKIDMSHHNRT